MCIPTRAMTLHAYARGIFSQFFRTRTKNKPYIPACLSVGSLNMEMIDGGCGRSDVCFPFIKTRQEDAQIAVEQLFSRSPLMSVGKMTQRFKEHYPGRFSDPCVNDWVLFVRTINRDENGHKQDTYMLIDSDMPFLSIPEYLFNNCCIAVCNNTQTFFQEWLGKMLPDVAGYEYLVQSAHITAVNQVEFCNNKLTEIERSHRFEEYHFERSGFDKLRADEIYASNIAAEKLQIALHTAEALKRQNTQNAQCC